MLQLLLPIFHAILSNKFRLGQEQSLHKSPISPLATHSPHRAFRLQCRGCWWIVAMNLTLIGLRTPPRSDCSSHSFLLRLFHKFVSPSLLLFPPLLLSLSHAHDCNPARGFTKQTSQSAACRTKKKAGAMGQSQLCRRMKRSQHSMELSISDMNTDGNCPVDGFH